MVYHSASIKKCNKSKSNYFIFILNYYTSINFNLITPNLILIPPSFKAKSLSIEHLPIKGYIKLTKQISLA